MLKPIRSASRKPHPPWTVLRCRWSAVTCCWRPGEGLFRRRLAVVGCGRAGAARGRGPARCGGAPGPVPGRSARSGADHPFSGRHDPLPHTDVRGRLRGRQRRHKPALRSRVQDGAGDRALRSVTSPRSRRSRGWRTWPACGHCCVWNAPWWSSTAPPSGRCPDGSCSTWTIRSTRCTAASNSVCSMPTTTSTASSPSWFSMAKAGSWRPCCARPGGPRASRSAATCAGSSAPSAPTGPAPRSWCGPTATTACRR